MARDGAERSWLTAAEAAAGHETTGQETAVARNGRAATVTGHHSAGREAMTGRGSPGARVAMTARLPRGPVGKTGQHSTARRPTDRAVTTAHRSIGLPPIGLPPIGRPSTVPAVTIGHRSIAHDGPAALRLIDPDVTTEVHPTADPSVDRPLTGRLQTDPRSTARAATTDLNSTNHRPTGASSTVRVAMTSVGSTARAATTDPPLTGRAQMAASHSIVRAVRGPASVASGRRATSSVVRASSAPARHGRSARPASTPRKWWARTRS